MKKVLEVRHLTKRYGQHLALDNVNLTLEKGEVYGLIGRNGAGKTTLIKVITKLTFQILTRSLMKSLIQLDLDTLARKNFVVSHWV